MKKYALCALFLAGSLYAEEPNISPSTAPVAEVTEADGDVFLSLTRTVEQRKGLPTNISTIKAKEMEEQDAATVDEVLSLSPSVLIGKSGTMGTFSTLRLRGAPSSAQTQVLLDDMPLLGISNQSLDLSQLPIANVERVEVVRGGSSALYGPNAIGGVVRLVTKKHVGDLPYTRFRGQFGSFFEQLYEGEFSSRVGPGDVRVSGGRYLSDGFTENQDTDNIHGTLEGGYSAENGARVALGASVVDGEVGNPKGTFLDVGEWDGKKERAALDPTARSENRAIRAHTDLFWPMGRAGVKTSFYQSQQDYKSRPSETASPDWATDSFFWGNDTQFLWDNWLTVGGAYGWDGQKSFWNDWLTGDPMSAGIHTANVGAYAQADVVKGEWRVIPALRFDDQDHYAGQYSPRVTVVYTPQPAVKISANGARSFRAPNFLELSYRGSAGFAGNPDLKPQKSWSYDTGVEIYPSPASRLAVTGFYTKIEDWITVSNSGTTYDNAPDAEMSGVEVESSHPLGLPSLSGALAYTYTRAIGNSLGQSTRVPLRLTPRHMIHYRAWWKPGNKWEVLNTVQYGSKQYYLNGEQGLDLPAYATWSARVSKRILAADLYFSVDNILDRRYALTFDADPVTWATSRNPQAGRSYRVGATIEFQD